MNDRHLTRRGPQKNSGFSWGRFPMQNGVVSYRLWRRDEHHALQFAITDFSPGTTRSRIAEVVNVKRNELRDRVDMLAFLEWEIAA